MRNKLLGIESVTILAALGLLVYMLFIKPVIGMADSGDFSRIMGPAGLGYLTDDPGEMYFGYLNSKYSLAGLLYFGGIYYFSTEIILIKVATVLDTLLTFDKVFDIRFLALLYISILLTAIYFILKVVRYNGKVTSIVTALIIVFIFLDLGYVAYFNSLYGEAVSFTFLLLTVALGIRLVHQENPRISGLVAFTAAAIFLVGAKAQNSPIGALIAIFALRLWGFRRDVRWKKAIVTSAISLLMVSLFVYSIVPNEMRLCNKYQSVFFGVLKDSPTPGKDLEELGLDRRFAVLAGTNYFMEEYPIDIKDPVVKAELFDKIDHKKIALFYFRNAQRYLDKLVVAANNGFTIRPGYLGNYERSENFGYGAKSDTFSTWSTFKKNILPHSLLLIVTVFVLYYSVLTAYYLRRKSLRDRSMVELFAVIGLIGIMQFIVPIIGDGEADLEKHLFLFNICFDIMLSIGIVWITYRVSALWNKALIKVK